MASRPAAAAARIGIDLGGTKLLGLALVGDDIVAEVLWPTPPTATLVERLAGMVGELQRSLVPAGADPEAVVTVGVGAPGLVDRDGVLRVAPNLGGLSGLAIQAELESRLGMPVDVENDATSAAWGEHQLGAARGRDDVLMVTLGTGIGGGLIAGGRIDRGAHGFAGEWGHMTVDPDGPLCTCGRAGCWEVFASGRGLAGLGRDAVKAGRADRVLALAGGGLDDVRGEHVTEAAAEGDAGAVEVFARFCSWVALGLVNLANAFDPEAFVIGGGLVELGETLLGPVRRELNEAVLGGGLRPAIDVLPAALGERAGAIGAAYLSGTT